MRTGIARDRNASASNISSYMRTGIARDNLSQEKIRNIKIPVPPLDIQQRLAAEVKQLEAEIAQSQAVIDNSTERKNAILTSYL